MPFICFIHPITAKLPLQHRLVEFISTHTKYIFYYRNDCTTTLITLNLQDKKISLDRLKYDVVIYQECLFSGSYVYVETSNLSGSGQTATLVSKVFQRTSGRCMTFYYHMYGSKMGTLNVYVLKLNTNFITKVFTRSGNQGKQWHRARVTIRSNYNYKVC
jgi:hypothetical protein